MPIRVYHRFFVSCIIQRIPLDEWSFIFFFCSKYFLTSPSVDLSPESLLKWFLANYPIIVLDVHPDIFYRRLWMTRDMLNSWEKCDPELIDVWRRRDRMQGYGMKWWIRDVILGQSDGEREPMLSWDRHLQTATDLPNGIINDCFTNKVAPGCLSASKIVMARRRHTSSHLVQSSTRRSISSTLVTS